MNDGYAVNVWHGSLLCLAELRARLAYSAIVRYDGQVPTRNVVLTFEQEQLVQQLVSSGRYQNASEVIREGLRLIERREAEAAARLDALRHAAEQGIAALEHGDYVEFDNSAALAQHVTEIARRPSARRIGSSR